MISESSCRLEPPRYGPPASLNSISWTSFCVLSSGKPCGKRACGLSKRSDTL